MNTSDYSKAQGHWILARMGKRVLRPGGRELTQKLVEGLNVNSTDEVAEFAPGMGYTASLVLAHRPKSYVGVDADKDVVKMLKKKLGKGGIDFIHQNASETGLPDACKDKVWGEAMLTMQADHRKAEIVREAHRILKKGGLYAIHELGLCPDDLDENTKAVIQKDLALSIKVNARPLTKKEWTDLLEKEGFKVKETAVNEMLLLEKNRMIEDEGWMRFMKISWNILTHPQARKRITEMKRVFDTYKNKMNAIVLIAEKQ